MSTQGAADAVKDAVQNVADKVKDMSTSDGPQQNLLLDEVTGERVSKTELKKRQKAREKDVKKAEREATRQAPPQPKRKAASQEEEEGKLNANVSQPYYSLRDSDPCYKNGVASAMFNAVRHMNGQYLSI